ncbi:MAG: hypothetical protein E6Q34_08130 [Burkholderiaceae bacterium]|nr:MAG: hypothetical protein E6Q34_08130 [Burkholderiaceae bacterium]
MMLPRLPGETDEQWAQRCDFENMLAKRRAKAEKKAQELAKMERANARRKAKNMKMNEEFDALENAREAKAARRAAKEGIKQVKKHAIVALMVAG